MESTTHIGLTIAALLACAGFGLYSYHLGTRPHEKLEPRMMPWKFISFGLLATGMMVLVHLINLLGFETGR
jgi:hypothetical protein